MIDTVVIFGDSFNYGHGCSDRLSYYDHKTKQFIGEICPENIPSTYSWPSLLQQEFPDINVINLANPGRSNPHIFRDFMTYTKQHSKNSNSNNTLVIFSMTNPDRIEVLNHSKKGPVSFVLSNVDLMDSSNGMKHAVEEYLKWIYDPSIVENIGWMTLFGAYGLAKANRYYQFYYTFPELVNYDPLVKNFIFNLKEFKNQRLIDIRNYDFSHNHDQQVNSLYRSPDNHVNDLGHKIYYERYIRPFIKKQLQQQ